jgi:hypothetical protein
MSNPRRARAAPASIAATSALTLTLIGTAAAQNADAEFLFNEAVRFEAAGKVPEGCDAFEASNRIEPRAGTLIRLGQCRELQGRIVSAWSAYRDALTRVKDPGKKRLAETRIAALEPMLSYLTVSVPDDARVEGLVVTRNGTALEPVLWNRAVPVDAGAYTIAGSAPGQERWQTTIEVAQTGDKVSVEVPRFKAIKALVPSPAGSARRGDSAAGRRDGGTAAGLGNGATGGRAHTFAAGGRAPTASVARPPAEVSETAPSMLTGRRKIAIGLVGVGLAAAAGGVVLGLQAKRLEEDAFALCPDPNATCERSEQAQVLTHRGTQRAMLANIAYGAGAAAVVGAAILWLTGAPPRPDRVSVAPRLGGGLAGVVVHVRF